MPLPVKLNATALGYPDYELRTAAREAKEHGFSAPAAGGQVPSRRRFLRVGEAEGHCGVGAGRELCLERRGDVGWRLLDRRELEVAARAVLAAQGVGLAALHRRKAGLYLNQGYPLTLEEEFVFLLPPKAQLGSLPGVSERKTGAVAVEGRMDEDRGGKAGGAIAGRVGAG